MTGFVYVIPGPEAEVAKRLEVGSTGCINMIISCCDTIADVLAMPSHNNECYGQSLCARQVASEPTVYRQGAQQMMG